MPDNSEGTTGVTFRRARMTLCLVPACAILLLAGDSAWKSKPIRDWTDEDAHIVLTDSPWAANVRSAVMPLQSESARMQGGNMGQPQGVGYSGLDTTTDKQKAEKVLSGDFSGGPAIAPITVRVRWESALPVRAAELKAHEVEPPTLDGDGYQIAVYGIPGAYLKGDPKSLGEPLRKTAVLKREGKPDVKPSGVEVFQTSGVVAYLFPFSAELSERDTLVQFNALIGRIAVAHSFDLRQMRFNGKLEL